MNKLENYNIQTIHITLLLTIITGSLITGYFIGEINNPQPDNNVVAQTAHQNFNQAITQINNSTYSQVSSNIDAGTSMLWVLIETGNTKWENPWFNIQVTCNEKEEWDKCTNIINQTQNQLQQDYNITAN